MNKHDINFGKNSSNAAVNVLQTAKLKLGLHGVTISNDTMIKLGDIADSIGTQLLPLIEGILDASVGERERLKSFGIRIDTKVGNMRILDIITEIIKKHGRL